MALDGSWNSLESRIRRAGDEAKAVARFVNRVTRWHAQVDAEIAARNAGLPVPPRPRGMGPISKQSKWNAYDAAARLEELLSAGEVERPHSIADMTAQLARYRATDMTATYEAWKAACVRREARWAAEAAERAAARLEAAEAALAEIQ